MAQAYVLSDPDLRFLRDSLSRLRSIPRNTRRPYVEDNLGREDHQAPETYVARTGEAGIPRMSTLKDGRFSPGSGEVDIYRILPDPAGAYRHRTVSGSSDATLSPSGVIGSTSFDSSLDDDASSHGPSSFDTAWTLGSGEVLVAVPGGLRKRVYNLSMNPVPGLTWIIIHRDKFGKWLIELGQGGPVRFHAMLYDKKSYPVELASSDALGSVCPPDIPPRLRGEYSWVEVVEDDEGEWSILEGGRFGVAGELDAAHEYNRGNGNYHIERMVVEIEGLSQWTLGQLSDRYEGGSKSSDELVSSSIDWNPASSETHLVSTQFTYWFNLCLPREDCAQPYIISSAPGNDFGD